MYLSSFTWTGEGDQMKDLNPQQKMEWIGMIIAYMKDGRIWFKEGKMYLKSLFGGVIEVEKGDKLMMIKTTRYPMTFLSACPEYRYLELKSRLELEEEPNNEGKSYSIACV